MNFKAASSTAAFQLASPDERTQKVKLKSKVAEIAGRLEIMSQIAQTRGYPVRPYESIEQLNSLSSAEVKSLEHSLRARLDAYAGREEAWTYDRATELEIFAHAMKKLGLRCEGELTPHFDDGDIVEIYDRSFCQIFSNFQFYSFCSYDLATLLSFPFFELYERGAQDTLDILNLARKCLNEYRTVQPYAVAPHILRETHLDYRKRFLVTPKIIAPLFDSKTGDARACVVTCTCREFKMSVVE